MHSAAADAITAPVHVPEEQFPPLATAGFIRERTAFATEFRIMGHEAGPDQRATVTTLANLLQVTLHLPGTCAQPVQQQCAWRQLGALRC